MIPDEQLIIYQSGRMSEDERARFEQELAGDADALRRFVEQERMDSALHFLAGGATDRVRVKQAILEVAFGISAQQFKDEVLAEVAEKTSSRFKDLPYAGRWFQTHWRALTGWSAAAAAGVVLMFWLGSGRERTLRIVTTPRAPTMTNEPVATASRNPAQWPFAADSPWNTPIGSGAVYDDIEPSGLSLASGAYIGDSHRPYPLYFQRESDPGGRIFVGDNPVPFLPNSAAPTRAV